MADTTTPPPDYGKQIAELSVSLERASKLEEQKHRGLQLIMAFMWLVLIVAIVGACLTCHRIQSLLAKYRRAINIIARDIRSRFGPYALDRPYERQQVRRFGERCVVPADHPVVAILPPPETQAPLVVSCEDAVDIGGERWLWYKTADVDAALERTTTDMPRLRDSTHMEENVLFDLPFVDGRDWV